MKRKLAAFLIIVAMLAGMYGAIPSLFAHIDNKAPKASRGILDLTNWRFDEDGIAALNGEWEFYADRLLDAANFAEGVVPTPETVVVPGSWTGKMQTLGKATYRLRVMVNGSDRVYGLKTLSIQMSARIIVNGQVIGSSGRPGDKSSYIGRNKPIVGYFTMQPGLNEIIIQVANYHFGGSSGINNAIYLGYHQQIVKLQSKALSHDWIMFTSYLIMGLYFIGLYIQRRKDKFLIAFGLLSIFHAVSLATLGERIVFDLLGDVPVWLFLRIQIVTPICGGMVVLLYIYFTFRSFVHKWLIWATLALGTVFFLLAAGFYTMLPNGTMRFAIVLFANLAFIYEAYIFVLVALHKAEERAYLIVAAIALIIHAFVANLNVFYGVPMYTFPSLEPFVYLLALALLMSLRFSNAYRRIEQLSGQLIRADKRKDEFLTKVAHEFKTPLHGIINIIQSVIENKQHPLTAEQSENMALVSHTAKRLSKLVYDILDLSRLREGEFTITPVPIHLRSMVEVILQVFSFLIEGKQVRLVNAVPAQLPPILADETRFQQIISNLLDNAIKYTEQGSIEVTAADCGGMIEISVKDTGRGMDDSELAPIFEPYKLLEGGSAQSFGLGLPIVKQLLELQHGTIRVVSERGAGTTFTISLPEAANDAADDRAARPSRPATYAEPGYSFPTPYVSQHQGTHTILAVDDNFSNLKVLIDLLEGFGYSVVAVRSGSEALMLMESRHVIDLVILDLMMPELSGLDVCLAIRGKYTLLEMPIVMVTASILAEDKLSMFEAGANDYLTKPFDAAELRARVKSLLAMKESVGKAIDMEVAFLQSQIKPHFLFNVLNTIIALSYMDAEMSRKLANDFADYLRGSFTFNNIQKGVPFRHELALIRSYAAIEMTRLKDSVRVEYDVAEAALEIKLPPLLIQPLVENAIRHGIGERECGGTVTVRAYKSDRSFIFEVEDDGVGMTAEQLASIQASDTAGGRQSFSGTGVGLKNIVKRLKFVYGTELKLQSAPGCGTKK